MNVEDYLKQELENCSRYELTDNDKQILEKEGVEAYVFKKVASKKFRKWSLDASSEEKIKNAIHLAVSQNKPLQFTFPFGGYKLWSMPTTPTVDWAEFFTIAYYCKWIAPILAAYQPGAIFSFSSDDVVIERMNNVPKKDTDAYFASFQNLIATFKKHFATNLDMEIKRVGDMYTPEEFEEEFAKNLEEVKKTYTHPDPDRQEKMLKTSALNYKWHGVEDFTSLSETEKQAKIAMGPIYHDTIGKMTKRRAFVRGEDKIVVFATPIPNAIALGTTKTSITKFWTGYGVLETRDDSFIDRILSPEQLHKMQSEKHEEEPVNLIDLPNFKTIKIYPPLNFTQS